MSLTSTKRNRTSLRRASLLTLLCLTCLLNTPSGAADTCTVASFGALTASNVRVKGPTVTADFNGDGRVDVATADLFDKIVSVALGGGDGTFALSAELHTDGIPRAIGVGDFNGDGKPDLAATLVAGVECKLTILFGDGAGKFPTKRDTSIVQNTSVFLTSLTVEVSDMVVPPGW
jgi:hypothetical protein